MSKKKELEAAEFFALRVGEAYMYHAFSVHRRPVYRHDIGDIEINRHFIGGLLDHFLEPRLNPTRRARFYVRLLQSFRYSSDPRVIAQTGIVPQLSRRGLFYITALLHQYGDMLADIGVKDGRGMLITPQEARALYAG
ncbi:hypothetical protein NT945_004007 [Salmonella enterica]|nr:hypothetical protein [Salmonella enterica]EJP5182683.1 hypothetical protein [Salmonella enterica]